MTEMPIQVKSVLFMIAFTFFACATRVKSEAKPTSESSPRTASMEIRRPYDDVGFVPCGGDALIQVFLRCPVHTYIRFPPKLVFEASAEGLLRWYDDLARPASPGRMCRRDPSAVLDLARRVQLEIEAIELPAGLMVDPMNQPVLEVIVRTGDKSISLQSQLDFEPKSRHWNGPTIDQRSREAWSNIRRLLLVRK